MRRNVTGAGWILLLLVSFTTCVRSQDSNSRKELWPESVEVYHDSRFDVWNRNRLTAGVQIQLKKAFPLLRLVTPRKQVMLDLYYTKQNDSRSQPNHLYAIGAALAIHF